MTPPVPPEGRQIEWKMFHNLNHIWERRRDNRRKYFGNNEMEKERERESEEERKKKSQCNEGKDETTSRLTELTCAKWVISPRAQVGCWQISCGVCHLNSRSNRNWLQCVQSNVNWIPSYVFHPPQKMINTQSKLIVLFCCFCGTREWMKI